MTSPTTPTATEALFSDDAYLPSCHATIIAVYDDGVVLDRTVFYATGGGQPGDSGLLRLADGSELVVTEAIKGEGGAIQHRLQSEQSQPAIGTEVEAIIDWQRRYRHMKMHTCMHLLCSVIDAPVTGGSISADRARLDFDLPEPVDKQTITVALNQLIDADREVTTRWISEAELDAQPQLVKTMSVQPPRGSGRVRLLEIADTDLQPCGGTHVGRTGEIGPVVVQKIEKKSRLNRRIIVRFADGEANSSA